MFIFKAAWIRDDEDVKNDGKDNLILFIAHALYQFSLGKRIFQYDFDVSKLLEFNVNVNGHGDCCVI